MPFKKLAGLLGLVIFTGNNLFAESFKIYGIRPLGMGGAYTAVARGTLAQYWNPAGLAGQKNFDMFLPVAQVSAELTGDILGSAGRLSEVAAEFSKISDAQKNGKAISLKDISSFFKGIKELDNLNDPKKGGLIDLNAGAGFRIKNISFAVNNFTSIGIDPEIDIKNLGLGQATLPFSPAPLYSLTTTYSGVNLADIINTHNAEYKTITGKDIFATPQDSSLSSSAGTLSGGLLTDIRTTLTQMGISTDIDPAILSALPAGMSVEQALANAIVNAATNPQIAEKLGTTALTAEQVADYVTQIEEIRPLVKEILAGVASGSSYAENESNVTLSGISLTEVSLGYGMLIPKVQSEYVLSGALKGLSAGVNLKYIKGYTGYARLSVLEGQAGGFDDLTKRLQNSYRESDSYGIDIGLLLEKEIKEKPIRFGLLARNINSPEFDQPKEAVDNKEPDKYTVRPQLRAGVSFLPFDWWTVALDLDLTNNPTALKNYNSQLISLGTELNLVNRSWFNIALRLGLFKNTAEALTNPVYTMGLGLNLFHFTLDAGAAVSSDRTEIFGGQQIPSSVTAGLNLGMSF